MTTTVTGVEVGTSHATDEAHFAGGLRGALTDHGWALYPIGNDQGSNALVFPDRKSHLKFTVQECGLRFIGSCVRYTSSNDSPPMEVWEPGRRDPSNGLTAADSWGAISYQAEEKGEEEYGNTARYVCVCLRVAGLRLRDVSNRYHQQLKWALREKRKPGHWFANAALLELYADCHSLVSELSSARDHLARIAAIHVGAPDRIDSLARLSEWVMKDNHRQHANEPMTKLLLAASGTESVPGWLRRLGVIRNEVLHRLPMAADNSVSALVLTEIQTSYGPVTTIRLSEPAQKGKTPRERRDPLVELSEISASMEALSRDAWKVARYPALLPHFTAADSARA